MRSRVVSRCGVERCGVVYRSIVGGVVCCCEESTFFAIFLSNL